MLIIFNTGQIYTWISAHSRSILLQDKSRSSAARTVVVSCPPRNGPYVSMSQDTPVSESENLRLPRRRDAI